MRRGEFRPLRDSAERGSSTLRLPVFRPRRTGKRTLFVPLLLRGQINEVLVASTSDFHGTRKSNCDNQRQGPRVSRCQACHQARLEGKEPGSCRQTSLGSGANHRRCSPRRRDPQAPWHSVQESDDPGVPEEKIPSVIQDIGAWPIPGLVVFDDQGFSKERRMYLLSTGKAVEFEDLEAWLKLFFSL